MNVEGRVGRAERKIETVEDAIKLLSQLIAGHDERLIDSLNAGTDLNEKITMLVDAQIRSEDKMQTLSYETNAKIFAPAEAQIRGQNKIHDINQALDKLTELENKAHQRIERLEN